MFFSGIAYFLYWTDILLCIFDVMSIFLRRPGPTWSSRSWIRSRCCRTPRSWPSSQPCSPASVSWPVMWPTSEWGRRCASGSGEWGAFMTSSCDDPAARVLYSPLMHSVTSNYFYRSAQWSLCNTKPFCECSSISMLLYSESIFFISECALALNVHVPYTELCCFSLI